MKFINYLAWILGGISVIILILFVFNTSNMNMIGFFLTWGYVLLAIAVIAAVGLPLIYMIQNPKMLKKTAMYVGIIAAIAIISYLLASEKPIAVATDVQPSPSTLKWTDTGIIAMYFFLVGAILTILVGGVVNMVRNR